MCFLLHGGGEEGCGFYLGVVKFPAMDPSAVGDDISMRTRVCCLTEIQRRTCVFWDWRAEISHVVKWSRCGHLGIFQQYFLMPRSKPYWNILVLLCNVAMNVSFPLIKILHKFQYFLSVD